MSEEIQGWKPPIIYDPNEDKFRIATQEDIDRLVMVSEAYKAVSGVVRTTFTELTNGNAHVLDGKFLYGPINWGPK